MSRIIGQLITTLLNIGGAIWRPFIPYTSLEHRAAFGRMAIDVTWPDRSIYMYSAALQFHTVLSLHDRRGLFCKDLDQEGECQASPETVSIGPPE
jgi:hypothetical protein